MKSGVQRIQDLARQEITTDEMEAACEVLKKQRVAVFIVAYNAERHLENVISRIPPFLIPLLEEIFVIDDSSTDSTFEIANRIQAQSSGAKIQVYRTPFNRGYGGNQKLGYLYSIRKEFDVVLLLHGDGQYPPEFIPRVLAPFADETVDAVFASRMLSKKDALKGNMPVYKWVGNQILTTFENSMLSMNLSEFHSGFRAYRTSTLKKIPFEFNSDDFHFDTEIIIQARANKWVIKEVPIPTYYGDEQCHVNGFKYALNCVKAVVKYKLVNLGLFYQRNFDFGLFDQDNYQFKKSPNSLHQDILKNSGFTRDMVSIEFGANRGILSSEIASKVKKHIAVDQLHPDLAGSSETMVLDLNSNFSENFGNDRFDCCIALDVIEHLNEPEHFLTEVFQLLRVHGKLCVSTANVCYLPVRFSLLLGQFNYGKRGILDRTHKRLFSVSSFRRMVAQYGFQIKTIRGYPPPLVDLVSNSTFMRWTESIHAWLSRTFPNLFAYNFLIVAERMDGLTDIFDRTIPRS